MAEQVAKKGSLKIARQSLPETLADSIRERILNGEFKEGEQLVQEMLAEEYEVSRMPVREALRQLESSGLVELKTHKGAVVTSIPLGQIAELFDLRALLECDLLEHAIPLMTEESLATSRLVVEQLEEAYHRKDVAAWGALNWEFHRSLYLPADRIQTLTILQGVNLQTDRYIRLHLLLTGLIERAEDEHREILTLCEKRKVGKAVEMLREHILGTKTTLLAAIEATRNARS